MTDFVVGHNTCLTNCDKTEGGVTLQHKNVYMIIMKDATIIPNTICKSLFGCK